MSFPLFKLWGNPTTKATTRESAAKYVVLKQNSEKEKVRVFFSSQLPLTVIISCQMANKSATEIITRILQQKYGIHSVGSKNKTITIESESTNSKISIKGPYQDVAKFIAALERNTKLLLVELFGSDFRRVKGLLAQCDESQDDSKRLEVMKSFSYSSEPKTAVVAAMSS